MTQPTQPPKYLIWVYSRWIILEYMTFQPDGTFGRIGTFWKWNLLEGIEGSDGNI
jgi:hypothetical protein